MRGEDAPGADVEHPCGGSVVVERPTAARVQSTVKAASVLPLLTRAVHRLNDIKKIYVSNQNYLLHLVNCIMVITRPMLFKARQGIVYGCLRLLSNNLLLLCSLSLLFLVLSFSLFLPLSLSVSLYLSLPPPLPICQSYLIPSLKRPVLSYPFLL